MCIRTLWGHTSPIKCIYHASSHGLIVSASDEGLICIHLEQRGHFVRSIRTLVGQSVDNILCTNNGYLVAYSKSAQKLCLFWLNGQLIASVNTNCIIECMTVNGDGNVLICGLDSGILEMRALWSLDLVLEFNLASHGAITCMWCSDDQQFLMIGSNDGTFSVLSNPEERLRLLHNAIEKAPILGSL